MKILVSGSSGMVGAALMQFLTGLGHQAIRLTRTIAKPGSQDISWDPENGRLDPSALEGLDAVVHLAGENIASKWTAGKKQRILRSRVRGTHLLADALSSLKRPPPVLISASAIGYYGDRGDKSLTEDSSPGSGFLADVCRDWEAATDSARQKGIRVVLMRVGMVLSPSGGALGKMLPPFRMGFGGRLGKGNQFMSWITIDDLLKSILFAILCPKLEGPVNAVAPTPVTNLEFTKILGRVLSRPAIFPIPAVAIRFLFGEMGKQVLLSSARALPARLLAAGFRFIYPELEPALRHVVGS